MNKKTNHISEKEAILMMDAVMEHGATLKDIHGITDDTMESIYSCAYDFYKNGQLDEAERFFSFLCMYDLKNPDYFIGLGAVNQLKKNYNKACDFYSLAYFISDKNFNPVFYSGQCQLLMGNLKKALDCFKIVKERCDDRSLIDKSTAYIDVISKNKKNTAIIDNTK